MKKLLYFFKNRLKEYLNLKREFNSCSFKNENMLSSQPYSNEVAFSLELVQFKASSNCGILFQFWFLV